MTSTFAKQQAATFGWDINIIRKKEGNKRYVEYQILKGKKVIAHSRIGWKDCFFKLNKEFVLNEDAV